MNPLGDHTTGLTVISDKNADVADVGDQTTYFTALGDPTTGLLETIISP